jgi:hypothetical protein
VRERPPIGRPGAGGNPLVRDCQRQRALDQGAMLGGSGFSPLVWRAERAPGIAPAHRSARSRPTDQGRERRSRGRRRSDLPVAARVASSGRLPRPRVHEGLEGRSAEHPPKVCKLTPECTRWRRPELHPRNRLRDGSLDPRNGPVIGPQMRPGTRFSIGRISGPVRGRKAGPIRTASLRHSGPLSPSLARSVHTSGTTSQDMGDRSVWAQGVSRDGLVSESASPWECLLGPTGEMDAAGVVVGRARGSGAPAEGERSSGERGTPRRQPAVIHL